MTDFTYKEKIDDLVRNVCDAGFFAYQITQKCDEDEYGEDNYGDYEKIKFRVAVDVIEKELNRVIKVILDFANEYGDKQ